VLGGVLAARIHGGVELRPTQIGARTGLWGALIVLVVGLPLVPRVALQDTPGGITPFVLAALGLVVIGALFVVASILGAVTARMLFPRHVAVGPSRLAPQAAHIWRSAAALFALGLIGVASLLFIRLPAPEAEIAARVSSSVLRLAALIGPAALLFVACLLGARYAPQVGLRSHVAAQASGLVRSENSFVYEIPRSLVIGLGVAVGVVIVDLLIQPFLGEAASSLEGTAHFEAPRVIAGILYGGITEEIILRWGIMSALVALLLRARALALPARRSAAMWSAIVLSSLVFGLGHLPAAAAWVELTPLMVARIVLLNAGAGIAFGWIFWRHSLEAAMVAHASGHIVFAAAGRVF
jgi:membrane protease YdiL (CAAX protease family)